MTAVDYWSTFFQKPEDSKESSGYPDVLRNIILGYAIEDSSELVLPYLKQEDVAQILRDNNELVIDLLQKTKGRVESVQLESKVEKALMSVKESITMLRLNGLIPYAAFPVLMQKFQDLTDLAITFQHRDRLVEGFVDDMLVPIAKLKKLKKLYLCPYFLSRAT